MRRNLFIRCVTAVAASATVLLAAPAIAAAAPPAPAPLQPEVVPVVGLAAGIGYSVEVRGNEVKYIATGVPRYLGWLPGSCQSALVDAVKAAPILGASLADLIAGNPFGLIQSLLKSDAIVAFHLLRVADKNGTVASSFANVPTGLYVVVSNCTATASGPAYGITGAFVLGPGWNSDSTAGGGSSFGPAPR